MKVNTPELRKELIERLSANELEAFLLNYFPPVFNEITPQRMGRNAWAADLAQLLGYLYSR